MFGDHPQEQDLYRSIAKVGSLLFEIGEVGKQFYKKTKSPSHTATTTTATESSDDKPAASESDTADTGSEQVLDDKTAEESSNEMDDGICAKADGNGSGDNPAVFTMTEQMSGMNVAATDSASCSSTGSTPIKHRQRRNPFGDPLDSTDDDSSPFHRPNSLTAISPDACWEITFEQFLASTLTEPSLVEFFEQRPDLIGMINGYKQRRTFQRQLSEISMISLSTSQ